MDGFHEIGALNGGTFASKVDDVFTSVLQAVEATGKPGKVTMTVDITRGSGGTVAIVAKVTDKTPEPKPDADVRWVTEDGALTLSNPKQRDLELRSVEPAERKLRTGA